MRTRDASVAAFLICTFLLAGLAVLSRSVNFEVFFVLVLLVLLALTELSDTVYARPTHLSAIRILIAGGIVIFGLLIAQKVMVILRS